MPEVSWTECTRFFVAPLAVLDPLAAIPIFLRLTEGQRPAERRRTALVTALAVGGLLIMAALLGESLLCASSRSASPR